MSQQLDGQTVVQAINDVATQSSELILIVQSVNITNLLAVVPEIVKGFQDIIHAVETETVELGGSISVPSPNITHSRRDLQYRQSSSSPQPFNDEALEFEICETFRAFVVIHQQLLSLVIGSNGLLSTTPVTRPLGQVLSTLESVIDSLAFGIIDLVPACAKGATNDKNSLDQTLRRAVDTYNP
ncbi:MAG: hypothetical protein Q9227_009197 [Pyrenula ochraceoflavens]